MRWVVALLVPLVIVAACVPSPKDVPCSNQGDCQKVDPKYGYCVDNRCVECLDDTGCGNDSCVDGRCMHKCVDGRQCPGHQVCSNGYCADH